MHVLLVHAVQNIHVERDWRPVCAGKGSSEPPSHNTG